MTACGSHRLEHATTGEAGTGGAARTLIALG